MNTTVPKRRRMDSLPLSARARYGRAVALWAAAAALTTGMHLIAGTHAIAAFLAAIMLTGWYAGAGPAVLVLVLSMLADWALPVILGQADRGAPGLRDLWFVVFCAAAAYFGVVRRRMESELRVAREHLRDQVGEQTAELRRKERYLEEAQRLSQTGCWAFPLAPSSRFWWSEEAHRIFGVDPAAAPADLDAVRALMHPEDSESARQAMRTATRDGTAFDVEYRIVRPDGEVRRIRSVGRPSTDAEGTIAEYVGVVTDITDRWRAEQVLQRVREGALHTRFAARLEERSRLAREMHDTLLQGFTGVSLKLVAATERMDAAPAGLGELRDVIGLAQRTLADARRAIWDMRVPTAGTTLEALSAAVEEVVHATEFALEVRTRGVPRPLDLESEGALLRVGREAVLNAVRHSHGRKVLVELAFRDRCLGLMVSDDGRGFAVDPQLRSYGGHWGLLGMRERAAHAGGRLTIRSAPDKGTRVVLLLPYSEHAAREPL